MVADRTITDFRKEVEERLHTYIPYLVLTINIEQARSSMTFCIIGKVTAPM
jgi:protein involved in polysaccharide export with SLBB domain